MTSALHRLFVNHVPLIDVRAETEFQRGAFPASVNLPILNDDERRQVGACYNRKGAAAAEALGHELVSGELRDARIAAWLAFIDRNPRARLYCFRGGKRSGIAARWLAEAGRPIERIPGGYKAMRRCLLDQFERLPAMIVVSGQTGVGKTELLLQVANRIDLEARARHRGSAFGRELEPQPAQIDFENAVAVDLLKLDRQSPVWVEDESRLIGRITLPLPFFEHMRRSPIVLLEDDLIARVDRIHREYVMGRWQAYRRTCGDDEMAHRLLSDYLTTALSAIRKRLGGARYKDLSRTLNDAIESQRRGDFEPHKAWIEPLLTSYYDPMYDYQIDKKRDRVVIAGTRDEILDWLRNGDGDRRVVKAATDGRDTTPVTGRRRLHRDQ